jgi:hypothetical protein
MMHKEGLLKVILGLVCLAHIGLGIAGFMAGDVATQVAKVAYGANLMLTPQSEHLVRILGAFMIAIGALAGMAIRDPGRHRATILAIVLLLALRVTQRLLHADEIQSTFGIAKTHIWLQSAYFAALAGTLLYLMPKRTSAS